MKASVSKKLEVTLVLDEKEAEYLGALTQNYLGQGTLCDEDKQHQKIRISIFEAIRKALQ